MKPIQIRFLGSGDAFSSGGRLQTCILLQWDKKSCLIDCGASSLIALKQASVNPNDIDTVLISHLHGDHFGGLPFLILDGQFAGRSKDLHIAGPPGSQDRVFQAMEVLFPNSSQAKRAFTVRFQELPEGVLTPVDGLNVTAFEAVHPCGAPPYSLRIRINDHIVTYSGDTQWTEHLFDAASGADLFICESFYYEKRVPFHLDYLTLKKQIPSLGCKRIILTHMSNDMLSHLDEIDIETAHDGLEVVID